MPRVFIFFVVLAAALPSSVLARQPAARSEETASVWIRNTGDSGSVSFTVDGRSYSVRAGESVGLTRGDVDPTIQFWDGGASRRYSLAAGSYKFTTAENRTVLYRTDDAGPTTSGKAPAGFVSLFNGKDLTGWHGVKGDFNPAKYATTSAEEMEKLRAEWAQSVAENWKADGGDIYNNGKGVYLTTDGEFTDYELLIDYKTVPLADSGIYLKHTPQVQIWDWRKEADKWKNRADFGSGSLWNNSAGRPGKDALVLADNPLGEWNHFRIRQIGARTSVWLNGKMVVKHAIMENYWDKTRKTPLRPKGPIQLQTHGGEIRWKNVFIKEYTPEEANQILAEDGEPGFVPIFNSQDLTGWQGATENYEVVDGAIQCKAGKGGVLYTNEEYGDFKVQLEFKLPPGGNNGLAIRYPGGKADAAYTGMTELQVLDTEHDRYKKIDPRQAHGSAYGMIAAHRGYLRPTGEWNFQEVTVKGSKITVELNGNVILDGDLSTVSEYLDDKPHPGKDLKKGYFGFAGHNEPVQFRRILMKTLD